MPELIEVLFNLPVDRRFTYAAPEGLEVKTGMRVTAPFGSRRLLGYVVADGVQNLIKPVGSMLPDKALVEKETGSIIVVLATDAPLSPLSLRAIAKRAAAKG